MNQFLKQKMTAKCLTLDSSQTLVRRGADAKKIQRQKFSGLFWTAKSFQGPFFRSPKLSVLPFLNQAPPPPGCLWTVPKDFCLSQGPQVYQNTVQVVSSNDLLCFTLYPLCFISATWFQSLNINLQVISHICLSLFIFCSNQAYKYCYQAAS